MADRSVDLAKEQVREIHLQRLLAGIAGAVAERGFPQVTVAHLLARSRVSRRTFYELFGDREECFLAAFDHAITKASRTVLPAYEHEDEWREQVRAGLSAILEFLGDEPGLRSLLVVDALSAGPETLRHRARVLDTLIAAVDGGRAGLKKSDELPPFTAEGLVGAVLSILHSRILARDRAPLTELLNPLMGILVLPYLGAAASRRELTLPLPTARRRPPRSHKDPLEGLDMRLTYRTVRVLAAIATDPGASNRQIADTAGIGDQGQISKLLSRLFTLGLIQNSGQGLAKGASNAWNLTPAGRDVEQALGSRPV